MRNTRIENIAEHSLDVAYIAHALAVIGNTYFEKNINAEQVAVIAMFHDVTEIITGDLPTPIKYYAPEIRDAYKSVEKVAANQLLRELPVEMREPYSRILHEEGNQESMQYVKAADKLSALIKCLEERSMGNKDFEKAENALRKSVEEMDMPEVEYFIHNFLPAYSITIDEINKMEQ